MVHNHLVAKTYRPVSNYWYLFTGPQVGLDPWLSDYESAVPRRPAQRFAKRAADYPQFFNNVLHAT